MAIEAAVAAVGASVVERWTDAVRSKRWVTAFTDSSRPGTGPAPVDQVAVRIAGEERVMYRATENDIQLSDPVVSRSGRRIAFIKVESLPRAVHKRLYVSDTDGSDLTSVLELQPPFLPTKGASPGLSPVAWSHDDHLLLVWGTRAGHAPEEPFRREEWLDPNADPAFPKQSVMLLDLRTQKVVHLFGAGRRTRRQALWGSAFTSQAWAPDNHRFVYMSDEGHVMVFDTETRREQDLGPGSHPTWSPDGKLIAAKLRPGPKDKFGSQDLGDYFVISPEKPNAQRVVLKNGTWLLRRTWYSGPPLWSPDAQFFTLWEVEGERTHACVVSSTGGDVGRLPLRTSGWSWGGQP
jgi:hypothetical protein